MVEHQLPKLAFAGSIPVSRSKQKFAVAYAAAFCLLGRRTLANGSEANKKHKVQSTGKFCLEVTPRRAGAGNIPRGNITVGAGSKRH